MDTKSDGSLTIFLITFGTVILLTIIMVTTIPLLIKFCCRKKKSPNSSEDVQHLLNPPNELLERENIYNRELTKTTNTEKNNTEIDCAIEYRTRGTQLVIGVANVTPAQDSWKLKNEASNSKIFLLVYLDGDSLNSPCESNKHELQTKIFVNEIFIFTTMPYDLSTLNLVIQVVLICGNWKYNVGILTLPLIELDQNSYAINRIHSLPFPKERSLVQECLLSLSIMKCKNTIKLKVIKLYFINKSSAEQPVTGLHLRTQITDFQNPLQTFDTTKKKYQNCITFNELVIYQFEKPLNNSLELEVQLLESYTLEEEVSSICGRTVLYIIKDDVSTGVPVVHNYDHLEEVMNNPDVEIVRWHPISFVKSNI